ncbi:MAG: Arp2/3 complex-activating protein rickA, partial [Caldilineaceae bacterium SB0661_bin_34]|nr:Arp2/3 complex-activating protein rickA [Caldilineaceae bacterium SB0661_bin_34]
PPRPPGPRPAARRPPPPPPPPPPPTPPAAGPPPPPLPYGWLQLTANRSARNQPPAR